MQEQFDDPFKRSTRKRYLQHMRFLLAQEEDWSGFVEKFIRTVNEIDTQ
jgi:hypothetical protein